MRRTMPDDPSEDGFAYVAAAVLVVACVLLAGVIVLLRVVLP